MTSMVILTSRIRLVNRLMLVMRNIMSVATVLIRSTERIEPTVQGLRDAAKRLPVSHGNAPFHFCVPY